MTLAYSRVAGDPLQDDGTLGRNAERDAASAQSVRTSGMSHDVFISYSHVDKATADAACATLERAGIRCWIAPRDITPGDEYGAAIVRAIDNCRVMVLIFSASANNSRQTRREVERGIHNGVPLVPMRIEDVPPTESFAYFMSSVHWLDALTPPLEEHLQKLAASIKALLQVGAPGPARAATPMPPSAPLAGQRNPGVPGATGAATAAAEPMGKRGMFAELMNFSYQRTKLQAFGWYLMYLLIGLVIGGVSAYIAGFATSSFAEGFHIGTIVGQISAIPYHILLGTLLMWNRKKDGGIILLVLAGVVLSVFLGALGGLIPFAVLACRPPLPPAPYPPPYARR